MNVLNQSYSVLVTRPKHQAEALCALIEQQGWNAVRFPTLEIVAEDKQLIQQQLKKIKQQQWLIFISTNAVNFALRANDGKIDLFKHVSIAAVGQATANALEKAGLSVDLIPETDFSSEGLLATKEMMQIKAKSCLIVRGRGGREELANRLRQRGAKVDYLEVYARKRPQAKVSSVSELIQKGKLNIITITSGEALKNLVAMVAVVTDNKLLTVPLVVISERIKVLAEQYNFKHIVVTKSPANTAIIETAMLNLSRFN